MIDIHQNKTDLEKKHLNKQMVKSLNGMRNVYIYKISNGITFLNDYK